MSKPLSAESASAIEEHLLHGGTDLCRAAAAHAGFRALNAIASGDHLVIDTATHVAVPKMSEAEARHAFLKKWVARPGAPFAGDTNRVAHEAWWLSALRSVGAIK